MALPRGVREVSVGVEVVVVGGVAQSAGNLGKKAPRPMRRGMPLRAPLAFSYLTAVGVPVRTRARKGYGITQTAGAAPGRGAPGPHKDLARDAQALPQATPPRERP